MEKITPEIALYALPSSRKDFKKTFNDIYGENFDAHNIDDFDNGEDEKYSNHIINELFNESYKDIKALSALEEFNENSEDNNDGNTVLFSFFLEILANIPKK